MLRVSHQQQVASILLDRKPAITINMSPRSSCATRKCRQGRAADLPGYRHRDYHGEKKKASASGPAAAMKPPWRRGLATTTEDNLRYSQNAPLDMYVNTGANLRRRSISTASTVKNIGSCAWRRRRFRQQNLSVPGDEALIAAKLKTTSLRMRTLARRRRTTSRL